MHGDNDRSDFEVPPLRPPLFSSLLNVVSFVGEALQGSDYYYLFDYYYLLCEVFIMLELELIGNVSFITLSEKVLFTERKLFGFYNIFIEIFSGVL